MTSSTVQIKKHFSGWEKQGYDDKLLLCSGRAEKANEELEQKTKRRDF